jgi:hypothetical protein
MSNSWRLRVIGDLILMNAPRVPIRVELVPEEDDEKDEGVEDAQGDDPPIAEKAGPEIERETLLDRVPVLIAQAPAQANEERGGDRQAEQEDVKPGSRLRSDPFHDPHGKGHPLKGRGQP